MKRSLVIAAVSAALLVACTPRPDPAKPQVTVVNGKIAVDQETIEFKADQTDVQITWKLPAGTNFRFPQDGIVFERSAIEEIVKCQTTKDGTEFSCLNRHTKPGKYKYTIKVQEGQKPLDPLDPFVFNR
jgi:hypothetical protein